MVGALGPDAWLVPLPDTFPLGSHTTLEGGSTIELLVEEDTEVALMAWARMRASGSAQFVTRLRSDPETPVLFLLGDLRNVYGVYVAVVVPNGVAIDEPVGASGARIKPRICRMRRSGASYLIEADESVTRMFGWNAEELAGRRSLELIHPDDHDRAVSNWLDMLAMPGRDTRWRGRYMNADGTYSWMEITNTNRLDDPEYEDVLTEMVNIEDEMSMLEAIRAREELFSALTDALPVGVVQFDATGTVAFANPRLREILGCAAIDHIDVLRSLLAAEKVPKFDAALEAVLALGEPRDIEVRLMPGQPAGVRVCEINVRPLRDAVGNVNGVIACLSDVTDSVRLRDELQERVNFDDLTGCHNRASTIRHLERHLQNGNVGVVFIDLDNFKPVNDTYGHNMGDELLSFAAQRLRANVRREDVVGRIGGDEFVVLYPGIENDRQLRDLLARLSQLFNGEVVLDETPLLLTASFGAAFGATGANAEELLAEADSAMYAAKRRREPHRPKPRADRH